MSTRRLIVLFMATAVAAGLLAPVQPASRLAVLLAQGPSLAAWVLLYVWFKSDVARQGRVTRTEFNGLVIAVAFIALPLHFLCSRGLWRGLLVSGLFYLLVIAWSVIAAIAALLANLTPAG